jgi:hypothetical protein
MMATFAYNIINAKFKNKKYLKKKIMSNQKKNFAGSARSILFPTEPYEMTYWKERLNSPSRKFQKFWMFIYDTLFNQRMKPDLREVSKISEMKIKSLIKLTTPTQQCL